MIHAIGDVAVFVGAAAATVFVIAYQLVARWWRSEEGRHLMSFTGVIALALDYSAWRVLTAQIRPLPISVEVIRTLIFCAIAVLMVWRCWILGRRQIWAPWRRSKKEG
jgi:hypothetical protein